MTLPELSRHIKREADSLLHDDGLEQVLKRYGEVKYVGSYELDLMLKKDLDISLINPQLSLDAFHELAREVSDLLHPHSMHFRNTRIKAVENRPPDALYWGFVFRDWNIDLWLVDAAYYIESVHYMQRIRKLLTHRNKLHILDIKKQAIDNHEYGKGFGSREIYNAVLDHGISSYEAFRGFVHGQVD